MAKSIQIRIPIVSSLLFVLCAGTLLMIFWTEDVMSDRAIYAAITLLLISYLTSRLLVSTPVRDVLLYDLRHGLWRN